MVKQTRGAMIRRLTIMAALGFCGQADAVLTYTVGGTWDTQARKDAATAALTDATNRFNSYGNFGSYNIYAYYSSGIPTAQASYLGSIGYGGTYPNTRVTMHEMCHYLGSGTTSSWAGLMTGGTWDGARVNQLVAQFDGEGNVLHGDTAHFWPYGLNYDTEDSEIARQREVAILYAMRADTGIGSTANPWSATAVNMTASDALGTSSFNYKANWSDSYFAHAGASYTTGDFLMRTPASGNSFKFYGNSLTINNTNGISGGLLFKGTGTTGITTINNLTLAGGYIRHATTVSDLFQLAGTLAVTAPSTIDCAQGNIVISSTMSGAGSITKLGAYTLTLSGPSTLSGALNVGTNSNAGDFGEVVLASPTAGSSLSQISILTNNAATSVLQLNGTAGNMTIAAPISISARSTAASVSIQNIAGNNTLSGPITLITGGAGYAFQSDAGTLILSNSAGLAAAGGKVLTLLGASNGLIDGPITDGTGTFAVVKSGAGKWTLAGNSTYTGTTTISDGILQIGNAGASGTLGTGAVINNATLRFTRTDSSSVNNAISGTGTVSMTGTGTLALGGTNSYTGPTLVSAGELRITSGTALGSTSGITVSAGRLTLDGGITAGLGKTITINGNGTNFFGALQGNSGVNTWQGNVIVDATAGTRVGTNAGTLTISGIISGSTAANGLGLRTNNSTLILSGANTYLGSTSIFTGTGSVQLAGGANRLPIGTSLIFGGSTVAGILDLNGQDQQVAGLSVGGGTSNEIKSPTSATLTVNTPAATPSSFGGKITGAISMVKTGDDSLTLTGANTYTGSTSVNAGTLAVAGSHNSSHGSYVVTNATLRVSGNISSSGTPAALSVTGTGLADIDGGNATFSNVAATNLTIQNNGTLSLASSIGPVASASEVTNLSILTNGRLDIKNNALIVRSTDSTSATRDALAGKIRSGQNGVDSIGLPRWDGPGIVSSSARANNVSASINLFAVGILSNHDLDSFYQYNAVNGGWLNGAVSNIGVNDILIRYTYNGDSNLDGSITIADYVAIDSTYGGTAVNRGWASGDFNGDGSIGIEDYVAIDTAFAFQTGQLSQVMQTQRVAQFGLAYAMQMEPIIASLASVPEPAGICLGWMGAMGLLARRRQR